MKKTKCAIIGSGNIGSDLMMKILRVSETLELIAMAGIDPGSDGLARAKRLKIQTTANGAEGLRELSGYDAVKIVFDATSAKAHIHNDAVLAADGKRVVDLTPAAIGPFVVPALNMDDALTHRNINMITCGGQATIPIVGAVSRVGRVFYAEIIASISSKSAGPGTRANIDEFTETTSHAIEKVGGAETGKAIIILNPAEPPLIMRDTVYCITGSHDRKAIDASIRAMVDEVASYVPGFRLKQDVQFAELAGDTAFRRPGTYELISGMKVSVYLEVEGAAHYLPAYAGNLDIMTSAALAAGERIAAALTEADSNV